jgi:hypothetical protein
MSAALSTGVGRAPLRDHRDDCYDTPTVAVPPLMYNVRLLPVIWEPACGKGNIVEVLRAAGHKVIATDLNDRGCPDSLANDAPIQLDGAKGKQRDTVCLVRLGPQPQRACQSVPHFLDTATRAT